jgi:hypothetical protein
MNKTLNKIISKDIVNIISKYTLPLKRKYQLKHRIRNQYNYRILNRTFVNFKYFIYSHMLDEYKLEYEIRNPSDIFLKQFASISFDSYNNCFFLYIDLNEMNSKDRLRFILYDRRKLY